VNGWITIITVPIEFAVPISVIINAGRIFIHKAITVLVDPIASLDSRRVNGRGCIVAVATQFRISISIVIEAICLLIDIAITVVVDAISDFTCAGMYKRITVVAVAATNLCSSHSIAIYILKI